ncbi:hypothetical protein ACJJU9_21385 [Pseudomonas helleri]|uniref:hypothetical protein n=1 Tax=Pseudomonas helleri TaxID=1608996 RepID=UPI00389A2E58
MLIGDLLCIAAGLALEQNLERPIRLDELHVGIVSLLNHRATIDGLDGILDALEALQHKRGITEFFEEGLINAFGLYRLRGGDSHWGFSGLNFS